MPKLNIMPIENTVPSPTGDRCGKCDRHIIQRLCWKCGFAPKFCTCKKLVVTSG